MPKARVEQTGWQRLSQRRVGAEAFYIKPLRRLERTHALAVAGNTLIALALADSMFFSIDPSEAKTKVALYLALTMAPFSVVAPLMGPWLDRVRGGRRWILMGANAARAAICVLMIRDLNTLFLFPEAFSVMVLDKSYHLAKSALVPTVVDSDAQLVKANSQLSLLSGIVSLAAAIPGGLAVLIAGSGGALFLAVGVFAAAAIMAFQVPATKVAPDPENTLEREELRGAGILLAASAMALLRGIVGFLTFLLAFELRTGDAEPWEFGIVLACSAVGALVGAFSAPRMHKASMEEERILQVFLGVAAASGFLAAYIGGVAGAALLAGVIGTAASGGKLAFDAIVQSDAPDANRGRSFARFETRFQLVWVAGAFIPVVLDVPMWLGFVAVGGCGAFALVSYIIGLRAVARGEPIKRRTLPARLPKFR